MINRRTLFSLSGGAALAPAAAMAQPSPPSFAELAREPEFQDCAISLDGKSIALLKRVGVSVDRTFEVHFMDTDKLESPTVVPIDLVSSMVEGLVWVNNDTLGLISGA